MSDEKTIEQPEARSHKPAADGWTPKNRAEILLRAAYDLLKKAHDAHYVLHAPEIEIFYDEADCDGACLMDDIAIELDIEDGTKPLKRSAKSNHTQSTRDAS